MLPQLAILGVTMVTIDTTVMHGYAFLASSMQRFFRDQHAVKTAEPLLWRRADRRWAALLFLVKRGARLMRMAGDSISQLFVIRVRRPHPPLDALQVV